MGRTTTLRTRTTTTTTTPTMTTSHRGAGASLSVRQCWERQAYSPENISQNPICCLRPNFQANTLAQGSATGGNGRTNFRKTRAVCCELFKGKGKGVDALQSI